MHKYSVIYSPLQIQMTPRCTNDSILANASLVISLPRNGHTGISYTSCFAKVIPSSHSRVNNYSTTIPHQIGRGGLATSIHGQLQIARQLAHWQAHLCTPTLPALTLMVPHSTSSCHSPAAVPLPVPRMPLHINTPLLQGVIGMMGRVGVMEGHPP